MTREEIIKNLNLANLSSEEQGQILIELESKIIERLNQTILDSLSAEEKLEYQDEAKSEAILSQKLPIEKITEITQAVVSEFKKTRAAWNHANFLLDSTELPM